MELTIEVEKDNLVEPAPEDQQLEKRSSILSQTTPSEISTGSEIYVLPDDGENQDSESEDVSTDIEKQHSPISSKQWMTKVCPCCGREDNSSSKTTNISSLATSLSAQTPKILRPLPKPSPKLSTIPRPKPNPEPTEPETGLNDVPQVSTTSFSKSGKNQKKLKNLKKTVTVSLQDSKETVQKEDDLEAQRKMISRGSKVDIKTKLQPREKKVSPHISIPSKVIYPKIKAKKAKHKYLMIMLGCIITVISETGLFVIVSAYCVMGGFLFKYLEASEEIEERRVISRSRNATVNKLWNITLNRGFDDEENWIENAKAIVLEFQNQVVQSIRFDGWDGRDENNKEIQWSFSASLLYSITIITTIGYGHIAPKTAAGRLATMAYALFGIPLTLLCLSSIGKTFATCFRFFYSYYQRCMNYICCFQLTGNSQNLSRVRFRNVRVPMTVSLMIIIGYILGGAVLFSLWEEDWNYFIAAYFSFITLSTIGFGDFVFGVGKDIDSTEKLITCAVYLVLGLSIISMCFDLMQEEVKAKFRELGIKMGCIKKTPVQK